MKKKKKKDIFDSIVRIQDVSKGSKWRGGRGKYYIERLGGGGKRVAKVLLNHKFLTGLFRTKKHNIFSGDVLLSDDRRRFLMFVLRDNERMDIIEK